MTNAVTLASLANSGYLRNRIINGAMQIDQRNAGASVSVLSTGNQFFSVDRFYCQAQGGGVYSIQQSTTAPSGFLNSIIATVTTPDSSVTGTDFYVIKQRIEGFNVADLGWGTASAKTVTLSFWARSSIPGTYTGALINSAENRSYPFSYTINSANTFEYETITIPGDTTGTWVTNNGNGVAVGFCLGVGSTYQGTANAWAGARAEGGTSQTQWISTNGATFYITGVQLEVGTQATPFEWRPYGTEFMLCQRYYETNYPAGVAVGTVQGVVDGWNFYVPTTFYGEAVTFPLKVKKRATPSVTVYGPANGVAGQAYRFNTATYVTVTLPIIKEDAFSGIGAQAVDAYSMFYAASAEL